MSGKLREEGKWQQQQQQHKRDTLALLDVLHLMAWKHPEEANECVGICRDAWVDERVWLIIIEQIHSPKKLEGSESKVAPLTATRLVLSAAKGSVSAVTRLLDLGAKIESKSRAEETNEHKELMMLASSGYTALAIACKFGHVDVARLLLDRHADIETRDVRYNDTALMLASSYGHAAVAELLLDRNADINAVNNQSSTALCSAACWARVDVVRLLLERGANIELGFAPLLVACCGILQEEMFIMGIDARIFWDSRLKIVAMLLERHANVNAVDELGGTCLMMAAQVDASPIAIIEMLLDHHAEIDTLNVDGQTCLFLACCFARVDVVRLLLSRGANAELGNEPALHGACQEVPIERQSDGSIDMTTLWSRRAKIIHLLVDGETAVNINMVDVNGDTAVMVACESNQPEIITILLDRHADIDALSNDNTTALWFACSYAHVEAARVLIQRGANVDLGAAPILELCRPFEEDEDDVQWQKRLAILNLLASADHNVVDTNGDSLLMSAVIHNQTSMVELFLDRNVDINLLNVDNASALWWACLYANVAIINLLLSRGADVGAGESCLIAIVNDDLASALGRHRSERHSHAAAESRLAAVKVLIDHHVDVNATDANGINALDWLLVHPHSLRHHGRRRGLHDEIVVLLRANGAVEANAAPAHGGNEEEEEDDDEAEW